MDKTFAARFCMLLASALLATFATLGVAVTMTAGSSAPLQAEVTVAASAPHVG